MINDAAENTIEITRQENVTRILDAAERLFLTVLDGRLKLYGDQHYNSINTRYYLGWLYQATGRFVSSSFRRTRR